MPLKTTTSLLNAIAAEDDDTIYVYLTTRAAEYMLAGFVTEANSLLDMLWNSGLPHSENVRRCEQGFEIFWSVTGSMPAGLPFPLHDPEAIFRENRALLSVADHAHAGLDPSIAQMLEDVARRDPFLRTMRGYHSGELALPGALVSLEAILDDPATVGYAYFQVASCAVLMAADGGLADVCCKLIRFWGRGYVEYPHNYLVSTLISEPAVIPYLREGLLAPIFRLDSEFCMQETGMIGEAMRLRQRHGRKLAFGKLSWVALLKRLGKAAFLQRDFEFAPELLASQRLHEPAATKQSIQAAAVRLGIALPDDYRGFLLASNGLRQYSATSASLAPVEEIGYLRELDPELVEVWCDAMEVADPVFADKLRSSIVIGGLGEEQQILLIPLEEGRFECWFFASWLTGAEIFPGFRYFMEAQLQQLIDDAA